MTPSPDAEQIRHALLGASRLSQNEVRAADSELRRRAVAVLQSTPEAEIEHGMREVVKLVLDELGIESTADLLSSAVCESILENPDSKSRLRSFKSHLTAIA